MSKCEQKRLVHLLSTLENMGAELSRRSLLGVLATGATVGAAGFNTSTDEETASVNMYVVNFAESPQRVEITITGPDETVQWRQVTTLPPDDALTESDSVARTWSALEGVESGTGLGVTVSIQGGESRTSTMVPTPCPEDGNAENHAFIRIRQRGGRVYPDIRARDC